MNTYCIVSRDQSLQGTKLFELRFRNLAKQKAEERILRLQETAEPFENFVMIRSCYICDIRYKEGRLYCKVKEPVDPF